MESSKLPDERVRFAARRDAVRHSVFLPPLAGREEIEGRVVVQDEVHRRALAAARDVLRTYFAERRRQP
jgi:hypothetical protein